MQSQPWRSQHLEILSYREAGEYITVQVAINSTPAASMDVHKSIRDACPDEDAWLNYLTGAADTMIQLYGDARDRRDYLPAEMAVA